MYKVQSLPNVGHHLLVVVAVAARSADSWEYEYLRVVSGILSSSSSAQTHKRTPIHKTTALSRLYCWGSFEGTVADVRTLNALNTMQRAQDTAVPAEWSNPEWNRKHLFSKEILQLH